MTDLQDDFRGVEMLLNRATRVQNRSQAFRSHDIKSLTQFEVAVLLALTDLR